MPDTQHTRSTRQLFKRSSLVNSQNIPISKEQPQHLQKGPAQKSLKSIKHLSYKHLSYNSNKASTKQLYPYRSQQQNIFEMPSKAIDKLYQLIGQQNKTEEQYQQIDEIFCQCHLTFFQNVRKALSKQQYKELIDKCEFMCYAQNKVISKKGNQDNYYYVLLDGMVSYNEEKVTMNLLARQQEIQHTEMSIAQKGQLLNAQTLNAPKHNTYTIITHSTATVIALHSTQTYSRLLKKYFIRQLEQKSYSLSNTSLFKGISSFNIMRLMPYFFYKNFYKFNQVIYKQEDRADFVYWILDGEVELIKEDQTEADNSIIGHVNSNKKVCKIVKLSKYQIFGVDQYVFKPGCKYLFTARVCSESVKTLCISYKSLAYIQNSYPCLNQNIDFYLKRASAMHSKIVEKNHQMMEVKQNIRIMPKKKKNKKNKKKKKNPSSLQWWGLAQNTVGNKKYKLQLPKFQHLQSPQSSKTQPMFDSSNYRTSKIQEFRRKIFEQDIDEMIQAEERKKSASSNQDYSPYKMEYVPKLNKLKVKMLDVKPKALDNSEKVKKKLLSYAKNMGSFCDKLNLD